MPSFTSYMLDVISNNIYPARITIENGAFTDVTPIFITEKTKLDVQGLVLPGFIDFHIHIESSMLTPAQFAKIAVRHGVTGVICDPHEIANVLGMEGIDIMIENASQVPFNFYFAAPSCVPATPFETSGATLDSHDIEELLKKDEIIVLGEMMNFPGVINGDEEVLKKLALARKYKKPIDGHAPLLSREDLDKYLEQGITDHECSNMLEVIEKKMKGMNIMVRDGSSAKNMEAIFNLNEGESLFRKLKRRNTSIFTEIFKEKIYSQLFDFIVSDDKHPTDLIKGYLDKSILKAVSLGINTLKAIQMVTINPTHHYKLGTGVIVAGAKADYIVVDSLSKLNVLKTYIAGECVFDGENVLFDILKSKPKIQSIPLKKPPVILMCTTTEIPVT